MTGDREPSWEDLLADPLLQWDTRGEVLPLLLRFGAPEPPCFTCRPGVYCPTHTPTASGS